MLLVTSGPPISAQDLAALTPQARALFERLAKWCRAAVSEAEARADQSDARADHSETEAAEARARVAELEAEIAGLKAASGFQKTPQNSSIPPSTVHPHAKPGIKTGATQPDGPAAGAPAANVSAADGTPAADGAPPAKRKRGGQPGRPKHQRELLPSIQCHDTISLKPEICNGCGSALQGDDPDPLRRQVWELPEPQPLIMEYQRHRLTCGCGRTTCAELPPGVPEHTSGPRLVAISVLLMALFRQSKSKSALALTVLFGVPASPGLMVKLQNQAQASLEPCYQELKAAAPATALANCD